MNQNTEPQKQLNWPSITVQKAYWREKEDHGGNVTPDRIKANLEWYDRTFFGGREEHEDARREATLDAQAEREDQIRDFYDE